MITRVFAPTEPTPLVTTDRASHVIATFTLLSFRFTRWTFMNWMFLNVSFKTSIDHVITWFPLMPWIRTLKAKHMSTGANDSIWSCHLDPFPTVRSRTPFLRTIKINLNVLQKRFILFERFWRNQISNDFSSILKSAFRKRADNFDYLSIINFWKQECPDTFFAKLMPTDSLKFIL